MLLSRRGREIFPAAMAVPPAPIVPVLGRRCPGGLCDANFKDAAANLVGEPLSILAYVTVPVCVLSLWGAYYLTELMKRPLLNVNDPHVEEILEPEHAH